MHVETESFVERKQVWISELLFELNASVVDGDVPHTTLYVYTLTEYDL